MASLPVGRRRIILLLLLTAVLLLTVDLRGNLVLDRARSGFQVVLSPFESAAQVATRPVVNTWRAVSQYDTLLDENRRLQAQIDAQRGAEIAARNAVVENRQLRALNELESLANIPTVTATVIGESPSNIDQVIEIDRGTRHGIDIGMAVSNEAGLVGKITRVYLESSDVMLISDSRYCVEVKILAEEAPTEPAPPPTTPSGLDVDDVESAATVPDSSDPEAPDPSVPDADDPDPDDPDPDDPDPNDPDPDDPDPTDPPDPDDPDSTDAGDDDADVDDADGGAVDGSTPDTTAAPVIVQRETGALCGQGGQQLPQVNFISSTPTLGLLDVGDTVFTTGGRLSLAPPDIPVGTVANVIPRPGSGGTRLEITPAVNLSRLQFVRVVLYKPPSEVPE